MFNGDERSGSFPIPSTCSPKIINNDTTNSGCDNFGAKDVLDHLNWEISLGYTKLVATGLTIIRGVKNYRVSRYSTSRVKISSVKKAVKVSF